MQLKTFALAAAMSLAPSLLHAQFDFHLAGRNVQVHSFASQGFAYSNANNYLTMKTSNGAFNFTDFGFNASTQLTDKFRVGAQMYDRNVGQLGNWRPTLDWAVADYRFKDWFGIRGGKVKTALGLYNDTQDMDFLHPWALVPQSVYPVDVRGETIAHVGGDIYGNIGMKRMGSLGYTVYGGDRPDDMQGGLVYALETSTLVTTASGPSYVLSQGKKIDTYSGPMYGADVRWTTPVKGLLAGASYMTQDTTAKGYYLKGNVPYANYTLRDPTFAYYAQYTLGNLEFDGEYRKENRDTQFTRADGKLNPPNLKNSRGGYVSAAYRISKWLEVGAYHSRFILNWEQNHGDPRNHVFDQAVTAHVNLRSYLDLKVEGHFIDGAMINNLLNRGFYAASNPDGLKPDMHMLVVRLGYHL